MNDSREFQVFVKPAGPECNLRCEYCYYLDKQNQLWESEFKIMPESLLEKYITELNAATTEKNVFFAWHGGEPTLAGLNYFRKAVSLQRKLIDPGKNIINGIQTNATLLNDDWCRFLAEENFMAGVSLDGPPELHDKFRKSVSGTGSSEKVLRGFDLLKKYGIRTEILTVVSSVNQDYPAEVFDFHKKIGAEYITFLPLVERSSARSLSVRSVNPESFGRFLVHIFNNWIASDIGKIKIQIIEEALRTSFGQEHTLCIFRKTCGGVPVVERNGDCFSCDHYADNRHLLGNIKEKSLAEMLDSQFQFEFGNSKKNTLPQYCLECEVLDMCNGECPKNRFMITPDGETGLNYLCSGYKYFFNHIRPFADVIAEAWKKS